MKKEEIHWADWHRIFFGAAPAEFLLEVLIRTVIMYLVLLVVLRLMGKRMGGQLTIAELSVMLLLGAIISVPMQAPEKGLLQGIWVLIGILFLQRALNYYSVRNKKVELITQGWESLLVKDGVLQSKKLLEMNISREQLLAVLRNKKIFNLGEVKRVYLEASGLFSIFKFEEARPGLALVPEKDRGLEVEFTIDHAVLVCKDCGITPDNKDQEHTETCKNCGHDVWTAAVTTKES
jgi:uncharacterized membrane protein YcaP (DUF421 family)